VPRLVEKDSLDLRQDPLGGLLVISRDRFANLRILDYQETPPLKVGGVGRPRRSFHNSGKDLVGDWVGLEAAQTARRVYRLENADFVSHNCLAWTATFWTAGPF